MTQTIDAPERRPLSGLRLLMDTQISLEKARVSVGNRVSALERGADDAEDPVLLVYRELHAALEGWEERMEDLAAAEARKFPVWDYWLSHVKGIGPALASQMLAMLLPPLPDRGPSTWYKAAGLAPEERPDGLSRLPRAQKPRCGACSSTTFRLKEGARVCSECGWQAPEGLGRLSYYPRLRRCLHNVATSFVRVGGYYRTVYETRKERLQVQHAGDSQWPPHRVDSVARWQMVKLFLSHLWEQWLEAEGQTGRRAYVLDVLKHPHYVPAPRWGGNVKI